MGGDTSGRSENKPYLTGFSPYLDRPLPCGPGLTASEPETPLAFVLPNCAQIAPAVEAVAVRRRNPRALDLTYVCGATTRRAANTSRAIVLVQLRQPQALNFFCIFSIVCSFYNLYILQSAVRAEAIHLHPVSNLVSNAKLVFSNLN